MATVDSSILITGGTSGLGYEAALCIAKQKPNAQIILASRSNPDDVAATICKATGNDNVSFMPLDLSSLDAIRAFVDSLDNAQLPPITALLLNAALQFPGALNHTKDGYEATFGINHIGHALLFHLIYSKRLLQDGARVVFTASGTHDPAMKSGTPHPVYTNPEELARPTEQGGGLKTDGLVRYTTTKLSNVYWTYALQRRLEKDRRGINIVAIDPGFVPATGLARGHPAPIRFIAMRVLPQLLPLLRLLLNHNIHSPQESGDAIAWLAISDLPADANGKYFEGKKIIPSSKDSYDVERQEALWRWTVDNVAKDAEERRIFDIAA